MNATNPSGECVSILQLTDCHFLARPDATLLGVATEQSFLDTLAAALAENPRPDIVLMTGDLAQEASPATYRRLQQRLSVLPCPMYCLPGNHDDPVLMAQELAGSSLHVQPALRLGHWRLIGLDSTIRGAPRGRLDPPQIQRLQRELDGAATAHVLVALHHHPVPCGSAWMDTMQLENGPELLALLARYPQVRGLVCGHIHQALDVECEGLRILSAPSTCFQFQPCQETFTLDLVPPGYRWIELHPDGRIATRIGRADALPAGLDIRSAGY